MSKVLLSNVHWHTGDFTFSKLKEADKGVIVISLEAKIEGKIRSKPVFKLVGEATDAGQLSHDLFDGVYDLILVPRDVPVTDPNIVRLKPSTGEEDYSGEEECPE